MSVTVARTAESWWVVRDGRATAVATDASTTAELLGDRSAITVAQAGDQARSVPAADLGFLSPVTAPCRVVAQMVNYRSHARDSGFDPATVPPTFFRKASASISGPHDPIVKPAHVRLLDYEVELGLVMGSSLAVGASVTDADLPDLVAGIVVANDVSARDVQLSKGQFYESKSYPGFTPIGPYLVLLDPTDFPLLDDLRLRLSVNDMLRQDQPITDMIVRPAQALSMLARFQPLDPGDLLLTGTPGGTALKAPPKVVEKASSLLPAAVKWKLFFDRQAKNPSYLKPGDVVCASIGTLDGGLDLGRQQNTVIAAGEGPVADG